MILKLWCAGRGPFVSALGKTWCPDHFVCSTGTCRKALIDMGFVEEQGALHCEDCYERFLAPICGKCDKRVKGVSWCTLLLILYCNIPLFVVLVYKVGVMLLTMANVTKKLKKEMLFQTRYNNFAVVFAQITLHIYIMSVQLADQFITHTNYFKIYT